MLLRRSPAYSDPVVRPLAQDCPEGLIRDLSPPLWEIKIRQWRGAVWVEPETGVHWVLGGGLAKGEHRDRDDFYQALRRQHAADHLESWFPSPEDALLLKRETAARLVTQAELSTQEAVLEALLQVHEGGHERFEIGHPVPGRGLLGEESRGTGGVGWRSCVVCVATASSHSRFRGRIPTMRTVSTSQAARWKGVPCVVSAEHSRPDAGSPRSPPLPSVR